LEEAIYTLIFTPDDGNRSHKVSFKLYGSDQLNLWRRGEGGFMTPFGQSTWVSRDGDVTTGEHLWAGWVQDNVDYYIQIANNSEVDIDYWLFEGNVIRTELGDKPVKAVAMTAMEPNGEDPGLALPIGMGDTEANLTPGGEIWYMFSYGSTTPTGIERFTIDLLHTPSGGILADHVGFEVFGPDQFQLWARGSEMHPFGAGSTIYTDANPDTGERTWHGHMFFNTPYFIRVYNDNPNQDFDFNLTVERMPEE
jgi:hypothetical protein